MTYLQHEAQKGKQNMINKYIPFFSTHLRPPFVLHPALFVLSRPYSAFLLSTIHAQWPRLFFANHVVVAMLCAVMILHRVICVVTAACGTWVIMIVIAVFVFIQVLAMCVCLLFLAEIMHAHTIRVK